MPLMGGLLAALTLSLFALYSASDQNGSMLLNQIIRTSLGFVVMIIVAQIAPQVLNRCFWLIFFICIVLLLAVKIAGVDANGAQRWLNLGFMTIQPSEILKIALPILVATIMSKEAIPPRFVTIIKSIFTIAIPCALIAWQPDLGTAILVALSGCFAIFLGGISWLHSFILALMGSAFIPLYWFFLMPAYQKQRVFTYFSDNPDHRGSGYHIIQSKIAIGSGGVYGKGWLNGTQSQLDFLPEAHTDFIFAVYSEEFGLMGFGLLMSIYLFIISRCLYISYKSATTFERLLGGSISLTFFILIFVNIGMVSGILPVVGVPLPLISYGGTSMITLSIGFGIIMAIHTHQDRL
jgi:rod shape determining protein RodA